MPLNAPVLTPLWILLAHPTEVVNEAFELKVDTREPGSSLGTGGMSTKIAAARTAHCAGGGPRVGLVVRPCGWWT